MAQAKPIKKVAKKYVPMVAGATKKVEPMEKMKVPTASEEYHRKRKEKEAKSYGGVVRTAKGKAADAKAAHKKRMESIMAMRERLRAGRSRMPLMGQKR